MPKVMLRYLAMVATEQLNFFPVKDGISKYYSPHMILKKKNIDYNKHRKTTIGTFVQAIQDNNPTNDNRPRTIDGIYLRPSTQNQGGHEIMNIATGLVITRQRVWNLPITPTVIAAVEAMAEEQGVKSLKVEGRNRVELLPADWIEGVDYNVNDDDDDDEPPGLEDDSDDDDDDDNDDDDDEVIEIGGSNEEADDSDDDDDSEVNPTDNVEEESADLPHVG